MAWSGRYEEAEPSRINRWLAQSGVCSRREAEGLIARGLVSIDGVRVDDPGRKIEAGQTLVLADDAEAGQGAFTAVLNKPVGDRLRPAGAGPGSRRAPADRARPWSATSTLIPDRDTSLAPLGRLDMDSRGLLLLSSDGVLAKAIIGPESELEKEYLVRVFGTVTDRKLAQLRFGLTLDGRQLKPAKIQLSRRGPPALHPEGGPQAADPPDVRSGAAEGRGSSPHPHRALGVGRSAGGALAGIAAGRAAGADQGFGLRSAHAMQKRQNAWKSVTWIRSVLIA